MSGGGQKTPPLEQTDPVPVANSTRLLPGTRRANLRDPRASAAVPPVRVRAHARRQHAQPAPERGSRRRPRRPTMPRLLALLLTLSLRLVSAVCAPMPSAAPAPCASDGARSERLEYLVLHVVGVAAAGIASAARLSYAPSAALDAALTLLFYTAVALLLAIALYVTYAFESPDMLLVGAAAGVVVAWRSVPRLWSVRARQLHWTAPMWRTRNGRIYRRVRRRLTARDKANDIYWNGRPADAALVDGEPIVELVEEKPRHWEESVADWQTFIIRGRLGEQPARRAALALRMAYSIPLPAFVPCGKGEYFASRGTLGVEVARAWQIEQKTMTGYDSLNQFEGTQLTLCKCRSELAVLLHLKMLLYRPPLGYDGGDWTDLATDWLFGELVISLHRPLPDVLACERVAPEQDKFWNLLRRRDKRLAEYITALSHPVD